MPSTAGFLTPRAHSRLPEPLLCPINWLLSRGALPATTLLACPLVTPLPQGYHVSRLAADLRELLTQLELAEVTVVGTSMGCAVIWAYIELFGEDRLARAVFVDQAPLQVGPQGGWHGGGGCEWGCIS